MSPLSPHDLLRMMRASDAGDPRATRALAVLEERARYGDPYLHRVLFEAKALEAEERARPRAGYFGTNVGGAVKTEQKGNTTVITIATPSANSNFIAFMLGAVTIAIGILLGVFLPGIVRRQR